METVLAFAQLAVRYWLLPGDGEDARTLLRHADSAMYTAKRGGIGYAEFQASGSAVAA